MSRWVSRRPDRYASIEAALPEFKTANSQLVARGYAALLKRSGGQIPHKNGLDLSGFAPALSNIALAAVKIGSACIFRIAGEAIRDRFSLKLVGANYYDLVDPARRSRAMQAIEMVAAVPCGFRVDLLQCFSNGTTVEAEACAFPLRSDEPDIDGFVLFADEQLDPPAHLRARKPELLESVVLRRDLIDLGFGVDEGFVDLVRNPTSER